MFKRMPRSVGATHTCGPVPLHHGYCQHHHEQQMCVCPRHGRRARPQVGVLDRAKRSNCKSEAIRTPTVLALSPGGLW